MDRNIDEKDEDMFIDYKNAFPSSYNFVTSKNLTDDENSYVLHLTLNSNSSVIASGLNTSKITVCDTTTLSELASFEAHEGDLSGMKFSPENTNYIYTSSSQECIKLWDIRDYKTPARTFIDTSVPVQNGSANKDIPKKPLISFDVNRSDEFIAAGTEQVVKDAFLLFWDVGSGKMLGGYWESYGDDVTTVSFHPEDNDRLATGGTDGLINIFDISQSTEDDALITSINTESSIRDVHWYKNKGYDGIAATSHDEEVIVWSNIDSTQPHKTFSREDLTVSMRRKTTEWIYLIGTHFKTDLQQLILMSGSSCPDNPCLRISTIKKNKLKSFADLKFDQAGNRRNSAIVRSSCYDSLSNAIYTGNENGDVTLWMASNL